MEVGDLVIIGRHHIGRICLIKEDPDTKKMRYFISTFPEDPDRDPFGENIVLSYNEFRPLSKKQEVIKYPNNYAFHKYGICTTCQTKRDANISTDKDEIECESCRPGWVRLFDTELARDLHAVELKHNVQIIPNSMREHNWKKDKRRK